MPCQQAGALSTRHLAMRASWVQASSHAFLLGLVGRQGVAGLEVQDLTVLRLADDG